MASSDKKTANLGKPLIGIVAGEPSGDILGAGLIGAIRAQIPQAQFKGIGGPKMRSAGCQTLFDMDRIELMGLDGLPDKLGDILRIRKNLYQSFIDSPPDIFVGIDVPDFNLGLERRLKEKNIKTVHYVSPTVWAWRGYRIRKIKKSIHHMLALFPFEEAYYKRHHIPVTCVGHPIADEIDQPDKVRAREELSIRLPENARLIGLLPGSRGSEVKRLAEIFIQTAEVLFSEDKTLQFVLPFANDRVEKLFDKIVGAQPHLPIIRLRGQSRLAIEASDIVVLASGTAALEAALLRKPHVMVYRLSRFTFWLFEKLRHVDHYSMSNHLLPKPLIPELVQNQATAKNIVAAVNNYIESPQLVVQLETEFEKMHKSLKLDANLQSANAIIGVLQE